MLSFTVCRLCASANLIELDSEMNIHFPGLESRRVSSPASILAFPKLSVCLDCGLTESVISEAALRKLRDVLPML